MKLVTVSDWVSLHVGDTIHVILSTIHNLTVPPGPGVLIEKCDDTSVYLHHVGETLDVGVSFEGHWIHIEDALYVNPNNPISYAHGLYLYKI